MSGRPARLDPLDARHMAEAELGFGSGEADGVPFEKLSRVAKELRDLRRFRESYATMQDAFADSWRPKTQ